MYLSVYVPLLVCVALSPDLAREVTFRKESFVYRAEYNVRPDDVTLYVQVGKSVFCVCLSVCLSVWCVCVPVCMHPRAVFPFFLVLIE
jgi:hypothetical protein